MRRRRRRKRGSWPRRPDGLASRASRVPASSQAGASRAPAVSARRASRWLGLVSASARAGRGPRGPTRCLEDAASDGILVDWLKSVRRSTRIGRAKPKCGGGRSGAALTLRRRAAAGRCNSGSGRHETGSRRDLRIRSLECGRSRSRAFAHGVPRELAGAPLRKRCRLPGSRGGRSLDHIPAWYDCWRTLLH